MAHLILVRHARPAVDPLEPASAWHLGDEGRRGARALAASLALYRPTRLATSHEPKALETAELLGETLGLTVAPADGLEDHHRATVPFLRADVFDRRVEALLAEPARPVLGEETGAQAVARFGAAVDGLLAAWPGETLAVVTHATVMALFCAARAGAEPIALWRSLGLPSFVALELPALRVSAVAGASRGDGGHREAL